MKRRFKDKLLQQTYDVLRKYPPPVADHEKLGATGARLNAYVVGYNMPDEPARLWSKGTQTHAAWAAGVDNRLDADRKVQTQPTEHPAPWGT
jgi:hypothetical protein